MIKKFKRRTRSEIIKKKKKIQNPTKPFHMHNIIITKFKKKMKNRGKKARTKRKRQRSEQQYNIINIKIKIKPLKEESKEKIRTTNTQELYFHPYNAEFPQNHQNPNN